MNAKRFFIFIGACSMAVLLLPSDAAAQRRGGSGNRGGGHPTTTTQSTRRATPANRPSGTYYRPSYNGSYYRSYSYRPYFYSPYFYNSFYASLYGFGWYPYYAGYYGWGYNGYYDGYYGGGYYGGGYYAGGYPYRPYGYAYGSWSSARIEVKPRDAQVYVDGYFVGVVDEFDGVFQRLDLPAGEHEVAVYMPGYRTYREKTLFRPGQGYHFKAALEPLAAGAPPELKPEPPANPPQQNGNPRPANGNPYGRDVYPQGPYRQPPPPPDRDDPGRTQPMPNRPDDRRGESTAFGTLNLRVQPGDATVQIDGERWDSPEGGSRLVVQLAAGPHRIEVRKDGYRPYSATLQIRPGEPQTINVSLPRQE